MDLSKISNNIKDLTGKMWDNDFFRNGIKVVIVLIIVKLIYTWWTGKTTTVTLIGPKRCASKKKKVLGSKIKKSLIGQEFTISMWLYVKDWGMNTSNPMHIMHIGDKDATSVSPGIWLYPKNNNIMIRMDTHNREDKYVTTLNCGQNGEVLSDFESASNLCKKEGYLRVCKKEEVENNEKSHQSCCPAWVSDLDMANSSMIGWKQGSKYKKILDAPLKKYDKKVLGGNWISDTTIPYEGVESCKDFCHSKGPDDCMAFSINKNTGNADVPHNCTTWTNSSNFEHGKPPIFDVNENENVVTYIPQTGPATCGSKNTWHRAIESGQNPHKNIGVHCCGNSLSPKSSDKPDKQCDIVNVPLQRWINLTVVLQNKTLDVYLNGDLKRSCILENIPKLNNGDVYITHGGGFNGYIADMIYKNKASTADEINNSYNGLFGGKDTLLNKTAGILRDITPSMPTFKDKKDDSKTTNE